MSKLILVDMDGVLVDWGHSFNAMLDTHGELAVNIPRHENQRTFNLYEGLNDTEKELLDNVMLTLDYARMPAIPGGRDALESMLDFGHTVMICTSPWIGNETCIPGKLAWLDEHLGAKWADRAVITKDKTVVHGNWLVDDKPYIRGYNETPSWTQIVFDQPYNQEVTWQPRLNTWADWDNRRFN